jgi:hypothetical protein
MPGPGSFRTYGRKPGRQLGAHGVHDGVAEACVRERGQRPEREVADHWDAFGSPAILLGLPSAPLPTARTRLRGRGDWRATPQRRHVVAMSSSG